MTDFNYKRYHRRLKERLIWYHLGITLAIASVSGFLIASVMIDSLRFYYDDPCYLCTEENALARVAIYSFLLSNLLAIILSRLAWSESIWIDFCLNRMSSILITLGFFLEVLETLWVEFDYPILLFLEDVSAYRQLYWAVGIIFWGVGLYFRSAPPH